jgi:hypothetical protein
MRYYGSHYILAKLPIWATTVIFATVLMTVLVGRDILEGLPYDVAYSSLVGDVGLMIVVLIAATILKKEKIKIVWWLESNLMHLGIFSLSVAFGTTVSLLTLSSRSGQVMDIFHDVIIAPLFLYLAITLLPVIIKNRKENKAEAIATILCVLLWASLVVFDITHDRMNQREWLQHHGVTFLQK